MYKKRTFTLIEMLIVIVIIGILAAALIPRIQGAQRRSEDAAMRGDIKNGDVSLGQWNLSNEISNCVCSFYLLKYGMNYAIP